MSDVYFIRNTTPSYPDVALALEQEVLAQLPNVKPRIINVEEQRAILADYLSVPTSAPCLVINADPLTSDVESSQSLVLHEPFGISRLFCDARYSNQLTSIDLVPRPGSAPFELQASVIADRFLSRWPAGTEPIRPPRPRIIFVDDDIASGSTLARVEACMEQAFQVSRRVLSYPFEIERLSLTFALKAGSERQFDVIDTHDFIDVGQLSGLLVYDQETRAVSRQLYTSPSVDLVSRAKLKPTRRLLDALSKIKLP